jgi:DNA invertase Pin-like site-specific DNA recombinase
MIAQWDSEPHGKVVGYVTVHDDAPGASESAASEIQRACKLAGWRLVDLVTDRDTGRRSVERPGIGYALDRIAAGDADGLVVSEITRLVRSQVDLASLLRWFRNRNAALVALDLNLDTSTAEGRRIADVLIALAEWDHDRIARKTKTGLADAKATGRQTGRPSLSDRPELRDHITAMRAAGMTLQAIADRLNDEGVPTVRGGAKWRPSSVQAATGYQRPGRESTRARRRPAASDPDPTSDALKNGRGGTP